jgi:hypothetical protein
MLQPTGRGGLPRAVGRKAGLATAWQGVAGDLEGATGKVSGKEERAGTHRSAERQDRPVSGCGRRGGCRLRGACVGRPGKEKGGPSPDE